MSFTSMDASVVVLVKSGYLGQGFIFPLPENLRHPSKPCTTAEELSYLLDHISHPRVLLA